MQLSVGIPDEGNNLYVLGFPGTGKRFFIERFLADEASQRPVPADVCYLNNFAEPSKPHALHLPAGTATKLKADLVQLVEEVSAALPAMFETEEYQARLNAIEEEFKQCSSRRFEEIQERARERQVAMLYTPMGVMFAPHKMVRSSAARRSVTFPPTSRHAARPISPRCNRSYKERGGRCRVESVSGAPKCAS